MIQVQESIITHDSFIFLLYTVCRTSTAPHNWQVTTIHHLPQSKATSVSAVTHRTISPVTSTFLLPPPPPPVHRPEARPDPTRSAAALGCQEDRVEIFRGRLTMRFTSLTSLT